ncbi:MAG: pantoate--beta-alanine ligase [Candidatus Brocadiaceae bacterium]|jgi:pantoate--beta-alanine ligase
MALRRTTDPDEARRIVRQWRSEGLTVGFVPTMGALHEGHLSLVEASTRECDRTVLSIYVNPTQFGPDEDLEDYPRRLDEDCRRAGQHGVDLVFHPADAAMYPEGFCTYVVQEGLTDVLEGEFRPTHFRGVLTVVCKLLNSVPATRAYFGHKDFQQSVVVRRMVRDLNIPVEIRVMPTVREEDGLAVSSRNEYLDPDQRRQATCLYRALTEAQRLYEEGESDADALRRAMREIIDAAPPARPDYVEIVDRDTLEPVATVTDRAVAALAVHVGETRLIDNMPFGADG